MENFTIKKPIFYASLIFMFFGTAQIFGQCPNIVWQDEFDGTELNVANWNYQTGDGCDQNLCGWGNGELQSYQQDNVSVSNGTLKITAKKERIRGSQYTSGRINSKGKADFTYGRFEASIKLPAGDGLWPAFWMLSTNEEYGGWPQSGEIDIMEYVASNPNEVLGYIHYGDPYPNNQSQGNTYQLQNEAFYDAFHEFAIEWEPGEIRWYMDGILFSTKKPEDISPANWPFDKDFHFLLNVAVGGNLGGEVNNNMLPATMEVDYVRVYDGFKTYITGENVVSNQETAVNYSLGNLAGGTTVSWSVPAGATIVSGQGSDSILVNFGTESGQVSATFNNGCEEVNLSMGIEVEPPYVKDYSFENFDEAATATFTSSTGNFTEVGNPNPNTVNPSSLSAKYDRNSQEQYDLIVYEVPTITDASLYVNKSKKFYIDVYTNAPVGTEIILQLETADATSANFPSGRHSRYVTSIKENGNWHRLEFNLLDRPDGGVSDTAVENMLLLFNSNSFTGDTYYFDNLDSYEIDTGAPANQNPNTTITAPSDGSNFPTDSSITITADASDPDGGVSQVEFLVNGNSIGVDSTSPYSIDWQVTEGSSEITVIATDNENASTTSTIVTVTGEGTGSASATSVYVQSIVTGTADAGKGAKFGTAAVTIYNDLGEPVQGATVTGTFSGSFNSQVNAVTGNNGIATLQSTTSAKGSAIVDLCVDNVVVSGLNYDANANVITCTGATQKSSIHSPKLEINENRTDEGAINLLLTPNPSYNLVQFSLDGKNTKNISIFDMNGKLMLHQNIKSDSGEFDISDYPAGIYIVRVQDEANQIKTMKLVKK